MQHPTEYVAKAIGNLRGYLGREMPIASASVFIKSGSGKTKVRTLLTNCILTHDPAASGVSEGEVDSAEKVTVLRIMGCANGGWNFSEPPKVGDEFEISGVLYTAQWVDWWRLGWKVRLSAGMKVPK